MHFIHFPSVLLAVSLAAPPDEPARWRPLGEPGVGGAIVSVEASPHNPRHIVAAGDMLGTAVSFDGGESWTPSLGLTTYEMAQVTFHPAHSNEVWVGSCSGPYRSVDGGMNWCAMRKGLPAPCSWRYSAMVEKILFDPADASRLLAFGGSSRRWNRCRSFGAVWESRDAGESWRQIGTVTTNGFTAAAAHGDNIVRAFWGEKGTRDVLLETAQAGWFASVDGGLSWTNREPVVASTRFPDAVASPFDASLLYASVREWADAAIWRSEDGGTNWTRACRKRDLDTALYAGLSMRLSASPSAPDEAFAWNTEYILKTVDRGLTWRDISSARVGDAEEGRWRGRGWSGWCSINVAFNPYREGQCIVQGMDACHGWVSDDHFGSWRYARGTISPWGGGQRAAFARDGRIYLTTGQRDANAGVLVSDDWGKTWRTASAAEGLPEPKAGPFGFVWADPDDSARAFVLRGATFCETTDAGRSWRTRMLETSVKDAVADPARKGVFFVKTKNGIFETDDFSAFRALGFAGNGDGRLFCDVRGTLYACHGRTGDKTLHGLWRYGGQTNEWTRLVEESLAFACAVDPADTRRIVLVTHDDPYHDRAGGHGVFVSTDGGATWRPFNEGLPLRRLYCCAFDPFNPGVIVAGTGGGGFFRARVEHAASESTPEDGHDPAP